MTPTWVALAEGTALPTREIGPITRTDLVRYQGASGDMNPIHHDEPFARASGFPAPLSVGMFQASVVHTWVAEWLGPDNVRRVKIRWKEPVFPGDVLALDARIARRFEEDGERRVDVDLTCTKKGSGMVAVQAWATYVVPA